MHFAVLKKPKLELVLGRVERVVSRKINPTDSVLREEEAVYVHAFNDAKLDEERFLKQKAKVEWLQVGDSNSAYFHKSVKSRNQRCPIEVIKDEQNVIFSGPAIPSAFIKEAMFSIGDDRAPGLDGQILKEINHTFIALIPKEISDNILITHELMHNYHRNRGPPRCAFKVDIQKAYDTVDWVFLGNILKCFGFHPIMIKWIMACVSSTSFSICINGDVHGFFKGKRGLRQGDLMSPYLFMLVPELLTPYEEKRVFGNRCPCRYHNHCEELQIINVCFADDLFSKKEVMLNQLVIAILNIMPFSEGELPIKYLGVPLISSRLLNKDCKVLVEKAKNRIGDWKNKSLSFASRLQLCKSVISSMHIYWASVLAIPKGIIFDIQNLIRSFLWCYGDYRRGKSKVAWLDICLPLSEGGLGLCSLEVFNKALLTTHIWNIVSNKESLWGWRKLLQLRDKMDTSDVLQWRDSNGSISEFSAKKVCEAIRPRGEEVDCNEMSSMAHKRTTKSIIGKILLAAAIYFIWIERNNRLFKDIKKNPDELCDMLILLMVSLSYSDLYHLEGSGVASCSYGAPPDCVAISMSKCLSGLHLLIYSASYVWLADIVAWKFFKVNWDVF
ncbi:ribonuclease H-like domain-containing protein [Tanacetum coccineum]